MTFIDETGCAPTDAMAANSKLARAGFKPQQQNPKGAR
jgi:hypothetical protein